MTAPLPAFVNPRSGSADAVRAAIRTDARFALREVAPTALADVRASLLQHTLADAQRIAEAALAADDAASARAAAQAAAKNAA